ncbi:MAG: hypothetical protein J6T22_07400 [Bacteroidales bacterium]|nr:hypothetical protein [Bacteroidales bacterium]
MRSILKAAAAVLAALLLAGCQNRGKREVPATPTQAEAVAESTEKEDTMKAYYERMRRLEMLLRGTGRWESDK